MNKNTTQIILSLLLIVLVNVFLPIDTQAKEGDKLVVNTFDREHMYINWGTNVNRRAIVDTFQFPTADVDIKEIIMNFTIGCASAGCDDWDRYGDVDVLVPTGRYDSTVASIDTVLMMNGEIESIDTTWNEPFEVAEHFEIMRFITAYGGSFSPDWTWPWVMDVSDYRPLLTGEVILRVYIDTWVDPGWEVTINFEMTEGVPEKEPYKIVNLWNRGSIAYGDLNNSIENFLTPMTITADPDADYAKVRLMNTGHGFGYTDNAAEFSPTLHELVVNGERRNETFKQYLWRDDCDLNPLSPQAGTWQFDRAGWCPGNEVPPHDYDITHLITPDKEITLDYNADPYNNLCTTVHPDCQTGTHCAGRTCEDGGNPYYIISSQVVYYKFRAQANLDVAIVEIENLEEYVGEQSVQPIVWIQNKGVETITDMLIFHDFNGAGFQIMNWTGNLASGKKIAVELPMIDLENNEPHTYEVLLNTPNGQVDDNFENDNLKKTITYGHNHTHLTIETDDYGYEVSYEIQDAEDENKVYHTESRFQSLSTIERTLPLPNGCYKLLIRDSANDGLAGLTENGTFKFTDADGTVLAELTGNADFGGLVEADFCVESDIMAVSTRDITKWSSLTLQPNPSKGFAQLNVQLSEPQDISISIYNISGQLISQNNITNVYQQQLPIDLSEQAEGVYMVQVKGQYESWTERLLIAR